MCFCGGGGGQVGDVGVDQSGKYLVTRKKTFNHQVIFQPSPLEMPLVGSVTKDL